MTTLLGQINKGPFSQRGKRILRNIAGSQTPVNVTDATITLNSRDHANRTITLNRAAGIAVTLPAATGSGDKYRFVVGTTFTANGTIKVANASDTMAGQAVLLQDGGTEGASFFQTAASSDTVTFYTAASNTTGGIKGAVVELEDVADNLWSVFYISGAGGTEATPFSATVS